ncbi:MAG: class I SAM-dependent methyltransferase [Chloroflexota bacterium]|nr:class I SAM-dependent methyltransferase [Chloroflexota bacterium]
MADRLIHDQIAYYRRRAAEYDSTSSPVGDPFHTDAERIRGHLRAFQPFGRVLELACGTGQWTGLLARQAVELTAIDSSPEMLRLNAAKVGDPRVRYVTADLFAYQPDSAYDNVFFGFWLSHVPPGRFAAFWELVRGCLAPDGRVFFVDEAAHGLWDEDWLDREGAIVRRRLLDGSVHRVVKALWSPSDLQERLASLGWDVIVEGVGPFYWGHGAPHVGG